MAKGKSSKTGARANKAVQSDRFKKKDDGRRFIVVRNGEQVYPGKGVTLTEAEQLASGLLVPARIIEVMGDAGSA